LNKDGEADDPKDESQMTGSSNIPEDAMGEDSDDNDAMIVDPEELAKAYEEGDRKLQECRQRNPNMLPNRLETQVGHLQNVLGKLPEDLAVNPKQYREEVMKREWLKL
jgi:hypothetical protein